MGKICQRGSQGDHADHPSWEAKTGEAAGGGQEGRQELDLEMVLKDQRERAEEMGELVF